MTFARGKSDTCWLYTLLAMIGEQFDNGDEICGAVVNVRGKQEKVALWTRNASNEAAQMRSVLSAKSSRNHWSSGRGSRKFEDDRVSLSFPGGINRVEEDYPIGLNKQYNPNIPEIAKITAIRYQSQAQQKGFRGLGKYGEGGVEGSFEERSLSSSDSLQVEGGTKGEDRGPCTNQ
ncbi:hypothetical protein HHK36_001627 [Tetracentron sinense]|uniref:eIF-4F 25 kDa subunit n=1 Tax=Tetracentron sinense TaxID=13715 RepID=A0A834ZXV8_TETSI|nr:hypothetical protein HHK36_001627 [Tetracentron sinense]